jgi:hypothetical protein
MNYAATLAMQATALFLFLVPACARAQAGGTVSVTNYGARCDGNTDDTTALRAAAAAVPATGAVLRFPKGTCVIKGTIYLRSHTHVDGNGATLLASMPWVGNHDYGYTLLQNVNYAANTVTDSDISVNGMTFDYGTFAPIHTPKGGKHAVEFDFARDLSVTNNVFQLRGAEDAVAGLGVVNMRVEGNTAYEFRNCAYDFWFGPSNVQVIGNIAQTTKSAQMVNFNPERTDGNSTGMVATGFVMKGNTLVGTGPKAVPIQIEPLGPGTSVRSVSITDNKLRNAYLVLRGNVSGATVSGNTIANVAGGPSAFESYPLYGGTGNSITFTNNVIVDPETKRSEISVIRMEAENSVVTHNSITGSRYQAGPIFHGRFKDTEQANTVSR